LLTITCGFRVTASRYSTSLDIGGVVATIRGGGEARNDPN
jgi:hypothetical protein